MDTNQIKSFAKQARLMLLDGVLQRLKYWGFHPDGSNTETLQETQGGYIFRGQIFTDTSVPHIWLKLKDRISNKQDIQDVVEEAAYTWFNRLMAIKILEENNYLSPTLAFAEGVQVPVLVQNAKRGQHQITKPSDKELLLEYLQEDKEEQAFGLLLAELCNTNTLLHDVFGKIDDYTELLLPQNLMQADGVLELINGEAIDAGCYTEVELIGWLYQFYISDKKNEIERLLKSKNQKVRTIDIPADTQIFTPKWIVKYMVENTVGKTYLDYEPNSDLRSQMKYLVENDSDNESSSLITDITELTLIDPACGSGHILVTGFELLFKMYREEGYTAKKAVESILKHNIYGLDIDNRAMQLARFAVLLKAAQYDADVLKQNIIPNIYSFQENTLVECFSEQFYSASQSDWYQLKGMELKEDVTLNWIEKKIDRKTKKEKEVKKTMTYRVGTELCPAIIDMLTEHCDTSILVDYSEELEQFWGNDKMDDTYSEFFYAIQLLQQGKNLGSIIKLDLSEETLVHIRNKYREWHELEVKLQLNAFEKLLWERLKPHLDILFVLTKRYSVVVANPPYMGQKKMNPELKRYATNNFPYSKADLMTIFLEWTPKLLIESGILGIVTLDSWMFGSSYESLRKKLIKNYTFESLCHIGWNAFPEGHLYNRGITCTLRNLKREGNQGVFINLSNVPATIDKHKLFLERKESKKDYYIKSSSDFSYVPLTPISYWASPEAYTQFENDLIGEIFPVKKGMDTGGNNDLFLKFWFEVSRLSIGYNYKKESEFHNSEYRWAPYNKGGDFRKWYGNNRIVIFWNKLGESVKAKGANMRSPQLYFKDGITWCAVTSKSFSARVTRHGAIFDSAGSSMFPKSEDEINFHLALVNSKTSEYFMGIINPTINFGSGTVSKIPSLHFSDKVIKLSIANQKISHNDWVKNENNWEFQKYYLIDKSSSIQNSYFEWEKQVTKDFIQLHSNEEALNKIFIENYSLHEELTPEVALKDITILQDELDSKSLKALEPEFRAKGKDAIQLPIIKSEVLSQFVSYAIGIFLGRYRLDKEGLNIAHPDPTEEELSAYNYNGQSIEIDDDGILPIMGDNCAFPDDALLRTKDLIHTIWGEDTLTDNINFLHDCLGMDLNKWLTEKFWDYHTSMYKKKPIYWLFSSNVKKPQNAAFKVLVYMHRMDKYTVQKIQRNYLHPHQEHIKQEIERLNENEVNLSREELKQLEKLRNWEIECRDYNEVLKELATQQIEFDLDDGVTVNYAMFDGAVANI